MNLVSFQFVVVWDCFPCLISVWLASNEDECIMAILVLSYEEERKREGEEEGERREIEGGRKRKRREERAGEERRE